jgi:predicted acyltransferase
LKSKLAPGKKFLTLAGAGATCIIAGLVAAIWFPIIKHIWSTSFVLFAGGLSFLLLAVFYGVIDVIGLKKWSFFFMVIGTNAIFVYCFSELFSPMIGKVVVKIADAHGIAVAAPIALSAFAAQWLILYVMWRKKIFIKV